MPRGFCEPLRPRYRRASQPDPAGRYCDTARRTSRHPIGSPAPRLQRAWPRRSHQGIVKSPRSRVSNGGRRKGGRKRNRRSYRRFRRARLVRHNPKDGTTKPRSHEAAPFSRHLLRGFVVQSSYAERSERPEPRRLRTPVRLSWRREALHVGQVPLVNRGQRSEVRGQSGQPVLAADV